MVDLIVQLIDLVFLLPDESFGVLIIFNQLFLLIIVQLDLLVDFLLLPFD